MKLINQKNITTLSTMMLAGALAVAGSGVAMAQEQLFQDRGPISFTATGGSARGYSRVVFEALNGIVRDEYPGSAAEFRPGSPAGSLLEITRGNADFAGASGAVEVQYALDGTAPFRESLDGQIFHVMTIHNELTVHYLMTTAWSERHGIESMADILEKKPPMRIAVNTEANLQSTIAMYEHIFNEYGFSMSDVVDWGGSIIRGNSGIGMDALRDGRADVFINGRFMPDSALEDIHNNRPLKWINIDADKMLAAANSWDYDLYIAPAGISPFITSDSASQKMWNAMQAGPHVTEETVYKFLSAIYNNVDRVRSIHPSLQEFGPEMMVWNPMSLPLHPGAERFYREKGLIQ
jgi:TRAP transporter TAXI family solute receptor